jgi:hypothetical protein
MLKQPVEASSPDEAVGKVGDMIRGRDLKQDDFDYDAIPEMEEVLEEMMTAHRHYAGANLHKKLIAIGRNYGVDHKEMAVMDTVLYNFLRLSRGE